VLQLVTITLLLTFTLCSLNANFLVVFLQSGKVFTCAYMRSNLWSMREKTSAIAVDLLIMQQARMTFARSPPGTTVGGW